MCPPSFFILKYRINPLMYPDKQQIDAKKAVKQWENLHEAIVNRAAKVHIINPQKELPDMVFAANYGLPRGNDFLLGRYKFKQRQGETKFVKEKMKRLGFNIIDPGPENIFEGQGEGFIHGYELIVGVGKHEQSNYFRAGIESAQHAAKVLNLRPVILNIVNPFFYHLDTCFAILDYNTALYYPKAFDEQSQRTIKGTFPTTIEVGRIDAKNFVCNAIVLGKTIITSPATDKLKNTLASNDWQVIEVKISEFLKAGGGCKCLALQW